ncbi:hypothetical protein [Subtercola boreus]|uniref:hypothetical protein n=1 Tax=Subtercola boreus TaxID=120213 RepID=UPI0011C04A5F|nr:hypothetical protein [Subtercola boreus]
MAVVAGTAVGIALLLGSVIDFVLVGLIAAVVVFGGLGAALRLIPGSLPFVPTTRSILGLLTLAALAGLLYLYVYPVVANSTGAGLGPSPSGSSTSLTRQATVVYSLTGSGGASISSASPLPNDDAAPASVDQLPWEKTVQLTVNKKTPGLFTLVAIGLPSGDDAQLVCTITVDGVVIAHDESAGAYRSVFCNGTPQ